MTPYEINDMLHQIPRDDVVAALLVNILMREPEVMSAMSSLVAATTVLASHLSLERRYLIAELMRDAADRTERVHQLERV